jgi:hypothetical protein
MERERTEIKKNKDIKKKIIIIILLLIYNASLFLEKCCSKMIFFLMRCELVRGDFWGLLDILKQLIY